MQEVNNFDTQFNLFIVFVIILSLFVMIALVMVFNDFSQELKYINTEIGRTEGNEQRYWKQRRWRLWLSLIPFIKY